MRYTIPGVPAPTVDLPNDLLEAEPVPPKFNILTMQNGALHLPGAFVKKWATRQTFHVEFNQMMNDFHDEFGSVVLDASAVIDECADPQEPPLKKGRITPDVPTVDNASIAGVMLYEVPLSTVKNADGQIKLNVRAGNKAFVVNLAGEDISLPEGLFIAGFGKTPFKMLRDGDVLDDTSFEFKLENCDTIVNMNGSLLTVGAAIKEKRNLDPTCQISYHKMTADPSNPSRFTIEQTHRIVCYKKEDGPTEPSQMNVAGKLPFSVFQNASFVDVIWQVRWTQKGLMPVRHAVFVVKDTTIPAGKAVELG